MSDPHHLNVPFALADVETGELCELDSDDVRRVFPSLPRSRSWAEHAFAVQARRRYLDLIDGRQGGFRRRVADAFKPAGCWSS